MAASLKFSCTHLVLNAFSLGDPIIEALPYDLVLLHKALTSRIEPKSLLLSSSKDQDRDNFLKSHDNFILKLKPNELVWISALTTGDDILVKFLFSGRNILRQDLSENAFHAIKIWSIETWKTNPERRSFIEQLWDTFDLHAWLPCKVTQPLCYAIQNDIDDQGVKFLLQHRANVHASGNNALYQAARRGRISTVNLLLEFGADPSFVCNRQLSQEMRVVLGIN